ncbi:MAG TPA: hypothetical protein DEP23_05160 [Ruminococcaceae bacterium]|nr:hypothetical protein [Oscillospiraceae bacterium]
MQLSLLLYYTESTKGDYRMKKVKIYLTDSEWQMLIHSLNDFKTKLHSENRYTDTVDEVLYRAMTAPVKRVKV